MDDGSSAKLEVQALLGTICTKDDPADVLFDLLPTPEEIHGTTNADAFKMNFRLATILVTLKIFCDKYGQYSKDPDFHYIYESIIKRANHQPCNYLAPLESLMACLALKKNLNEGSSDQGTKKDQLLTYYLWRIHGTKDEASPITAADSASAKVTGASGFVSHDFLPSSGTARGPCSNCGHAQATNLCSGCSIVKSGKVVLATFYCDRGCMKAHWKIHKPICRDVRALRRAATFFTKLWLEYSQLRDYRAIESVTEKNGLIHMKIDFRTDIRSLLEGMLQQFPRHLVESEEQALACISTGACEDIAEEGRLLFELLIRPVCVFVEAVRVIIKNAHKTIQISHPGDQHSFSSMYSHVVFRLTLPSGLRLAFDPTGPQYGWKENLAPWNAYEEHRVYYTESIDTIDAWGPERLMAEVGGDMLPICQYSDRGMKRGQQTSLMLVSYVVNKSISALLEDGGTEELLYRLSDDLFEEFSELVIKLARDTFEQQHEKEKNDDGTTTKLLLDQDLKVFALPKSDQSHS